MKKSTNTSSKFALLILLTIFLYSCGQSNGWTKQEKEDFVSACVKSNSGAVSEEKATEICTCMLNKMAEKYPTMAESQQAMDIKAIEEMSVSCKE